MSYSIISYIFNRIFNFQSGDFVIQVFFMCSIALKNGQSIYLLLLLIMLPSLDFQNQARVNSLSQNSFFIPSSYNEIPYFLSICSLSFCQNSSSTSEKSLFIFLQKLSNENKILQMKFQRLSMLKNIYVFSSQCDPLFCLLRLLFVADKDQLINRQSSLQYTLNRSTMNEMKSPTSSVIIFKYIDGQLSFKESQVNPKSSTYLESKYAIGFFYVFYI
ncbi:transmembrane protein, putative (macronuclear) [Tetrahymena thermophila SB210]|uniref:Transmembrane protein, putative n=1 Tax=Tetrahymena thermophila (strain SB210) TaxID=312017 RepID=W7X5P1_TETTS|nr:transmembrane protein, putative [Tetrahymena thermophila SB210]EWS74680.1 transmembrane protein, putative [Tetrahymena thermophila SB210]|eukprot:XP_012652770.1 transmembrane protein, putative [Tetrahymena thermophila SB210]